MIVEERVIGLEYQLSKLSNESIIDKIHGIVSNKASVKKQSKNVYLHHNGFIKMNIFDDFEGNNLAMHFWDRNVFKTSKGLNIHNHRWNFASRVLFGSIRNDIYRVKETAENIYYEYRYSAERNSNSSLKSNKKRVGLELCKSEYYYQGNEYFQDMNEIHRIVPIEDIACTLVLRPYAQVKSSLVFDHKKQEYSGKMGIQNNSISKDNLLSILKKVLDKIVTNEK